MKNQIKLGLLLTFLVSSLFSYSNVVVFESYKDYKNEEGEKYEDYVSCNGSNCSILKFLTAENEEVKIECLDIWGFTYKGVIFRINSKGRPMRLISKNNIYYYENGYAHLTMLRDNVNTAEFRAGSICGFSNSMKSDVFGFPIAGNKGGRTEREFKLYVKENPQHDELMDCMTEIKRWYIPLDEIRACVLAYQEK